MLLSFLQQEGDVLFQQDNAHPHMAAATQRALRGVQQIPWPARIPDLAPIEHIWDMMKWELTFSPEPASTIAELRQRLHDAWDSVSQDDIRRFYDCFACELSRVSICRGYPGSWVLGDFVVCPG